MEPGDLVNLLCSHNKLLFLLVSRPKIQYSFWIPLCYLQVLAVYQVTGMCNLFWSGFSIAIYAMEKGLPDTKVGLVTLPNQS